MSGRPHAVTCRVCGARGLEPDDDIAPGLCPRCLDAAMARLTVQFIGLLEMLGPAAAVRAMRSRMVAAGLTPLAAGRFLDALAAGRTEL